MKPIKAILASAAMLCLAGCAKFSAECDLVVMPRLMSVESSPLDGAAYMTRVYAFYLPEKEVEDWAPGSYADADAGVIRHKTTGRVRSHSIMNDQGDDTYVHLGITSSPMVLVAVDPVNRFYACRTFEYMVPTRRIQIPVRFQLWKWSAPYLDTEWTVTSERYEETPAS